MYWFLKISLRVVRWAASHCVSKTYLPGTQAHNRLIDNIIADAKGDIGWYN